MGGPRSEWPRVIGCTPFERPDARLAAALLRSSGLAVLDVGHDRAQASMALAVLDGVGVPYGVRVSGPHVLTNVDTPARAEWIVLPAGVPLPPWRPRRVLVQVTSLGEAAAALAAGAWGIIAKGGESGGTVGEETAFVLLQRLRAALGEAPRIWVQGGIGLHTAAAAVAGGATGVYLDAQLALVAESELAPELRRLVAALDGSETVVVAGRRVLQRAPEVAAGQEAAFARPLADRFCTAAAVIDAVDLSITSHLADASTVDALAPGSPLAAAHGIRYPIVQGPMTRVSDRPDFAEAVAQAGGLPFLALSLLRAAEARPILEQTRDRCAAVGVPWGVGILGFSPPELRDEQLALVRELAPPAAIIAGGRPQQAHALEEVGVAAYLHAPSPGLVDLFLKEGVRRFVLEGRECGGHVGPRSSFVLWESVIERLLADRACGEVSVLFAGGIHDARSAAMVAAAAAPLALRGAKVGVLLGTAYLFTEEAVTSGAILPGFQKEALACDQTVLLDTGPGHSTRCAETEYVRAFRRERERLTAEGADPRTLWEALERLNLGRLRVAAKGLVRDEGALRAVDEPTQRREGLFMIGQVAALRERVVTMAELHADVSEGASRWLAARAALSAGPDPAPVPRRPAAAPRPPRVAIVGMAAIFPGAPDLDSYWRNILGNVDSVTEVPAERWNVELYYDPAGTGDKTPSKWGGFLPAIAFDPGRYGIPPRSLAAIEPVQLLGLEVARRALDDAGYGERPFDRERASVIFGAEAGTDLSSALGFRAQHRGLLGELPEELDRALPKLTEESFAGVLSNVISGRIANRLDLGGANFTVDAACASSLAAVDLAIKELAAGESDLVVCGGADLHNGIVDYLLFASVHALSPSGRCKPFDATADGIALGEGVAALVVKRLDDAIRDGDRVYAVIDAVGASSDGKSLGLTAPRKEGQVRALARAYERAGISPTEVELVEAHGTGTVVGDRTELAALTETYAAAGARPGQTTLGSVKSQIGHTKCAAGLAGIIKAALAIHHRVLPPTRGVGKPNAFWDAERSPFVFRDRAAPWLSERRRAGVSAFGFGGTNFHAVLSDWPSAPAPATGLHAWPCELFLVRGRTRAEADEAALRLAEVTSGPGIHLADLAAATAARGQGPVQIAFVAGSLEEVASRARSAVGRDRSAEGPGPFVRDLDPEITGGRLAVLVPGQGSQRPGMLDDLLIAFPGLADLRALARGFADKLFPGASFSPADRTAKAAALTDTRVAQPALGVAGLALLRALDRAGVRAEMLGGHSYGELVALCAAGVFDEVSLIALSAARARSILEAAGDDPGTMAAVKAGADEVTRVLDPRSAVVVANLNAPDQVVISGPHAAIDAALARLEAAGVSARKLPVACAFHSPVVAEGAVRFAEHLRRVALRAPDRPVYGNSTAAPYPSDVEAVRRQLAQQLAQPVRFAAEVEAMYAAGARVFVEAGPGNVLGNLVGRILGSRPHLVVACDQAGPSSLASFLAALARLATAGVEVDAGALFAERPVQAVDLDRPAALSPMTWWVDGHRARPLQGEAPDFAMRPVLAPVAPRPTVPPLQPGGERAQVVVEYLRTMREMVEQQRQVVMGFLGASPTPLAAPAPILDVTPAAAPVRALPAPAAPRPPLEVLTEIVAERTGYPPEMLGADLDLEADLGIDSIKRIEILGTLGERLGLAAMQGRSRSQLIEEVATKKTLRAISSWVEAQTAGPTSDPEPVPASASAPAPDPSPPLHRYVLRASPLPPAAVNGFVIDGRRFCLIDDGRGVAQALAALLRLRGARPEILTDSGAITGPVDGIVHLAPLGSTAPEDDRKRLFELARAAVEGGAEWLLVATAQAGTPAARPEHGGLAGLVKSLAKETPSLRARAVDLDAAASVEWLADRLLAELLSDDGLVHVVYSAGERMALRAVAEATPERSATPLFTRDDVVLITGGARGITARLAIALAGRFGCAVELVGRSAAPPPEEPALAGCSGAPELRRVLVTRGGCAPAEIEARVARILADREIRATLEALAAAGVAVRYHAADVRDAAALGAVIDDVAARHGRLDAIFHGAGVIEDKLLKHKTRASFDRVFDTKVAGARALAARLRPETRYLVFFSSVSGTFGNRGQTDYAAANEALDHLAHHLSREGGPRVLSVAWGPWAGTGMVSPELEREYARRGLGLIRPDEAVEHLLAELGGERTSGRDPHVILMCGTPASFEE